MLACNYNTFMHTLVNLYFGFLSVYSLVLQTLIEVARILERAYETWTVIYQPFPVCKHLSVVYTCIYYPPVTIETTVK